MGQQKRQQFQYQITHIISATTAALISLFLIIPQSITYAQRAVPGGHAMDANTHAYNGKYNAPLQPFLLNELNNAIVTGNVPRGKGFRGDVGYSAAGDFRGATSTDKFYRFQTDSYFSGLPLQGLQPFQSLGYDVSIKGQYIPNPLSMTMLKRQFSATNLIETPKYNSADTMSRKFNTEGSLKDIREFSKAVDMLNQDFSGRTTNMMYHNSLNQLNDFSKTQRKLDRKVRVYSFRTLPDNVSELSDRYSLDAITQQYNASELTDNNYLNTNNNYNLKPAQTGNTDNGLISNRIETRKSGAAPVSLKLGQDKYADLLANMVTAGNPSLSATPDNNPANKIYTNEMLQAMQDLDKQLSKIGYDIASRKSTNTSTTITPPNAPKNQAQKPDTDKSPAKDFRDFSHLDIKTLTANLKPIKNLTSDTSDSQFNKIMTEAENALISGQYFDAERHFQTALNLVPNNPFALAGKIHSQMAAGLYLSATRNLRSLFTQHPEFIGIKYDKNLIPPPVRINSLITDIMNLSETDPQQWNDAGLLLAYTGHITANQDLVKQGLDNWQKNTPDDTLVQIIRDIWLIQ